MEYMEFLIGEAEVTCRCLEDLDGMRPSLIGFCVTVAVLFIGLIAMIPVDFITDFTNEYRIAFLIVLFWFSVEIILTSVIILTDIIPFASVSPFFRVLTYSWECIDAAVVSAMAYSRIYE